jgi:hypothetical protein
LGPADHHHEATVGLLQVIVVDSSDIEEQLALVAMCKRLAVVEAEAGTTSLCHLFNGQALDGREVGTAAPIVVVVGVVAVVVVVVAFGEEGALASKSAPCSPRR